MRRVAILAVLLGLSVCVPSAHAEAFLLDGGAKLYGDVVREWQDDDEVDWLRIRTSFGRVDLPKKSVRRRLRSERDSHTVHVAEARVTSFEGTVQRSQDKGRTWTTIVERAATNDGSHEFPVALHPGDRLRSAEESTADLDLGWGVLHLAQESEIELAKKGRASVRLRRGRMGGEVEALPGERRFRVETPQATMGVRGTVFSVSLVGEATRSSVLEGQVAVAEVVVEDGDSVVVAADGGTSEGDYDADEPLLERASDALRFSRIDWLLVPGGRVTVATPANSPGNPRDLNLPETGKAEDWADWMRSDENGVTVRVRPLLVSRTEVTGDQYRRFTDWMGRHEPIWIDPAVREGVEAGNWQHDMWGELAPEEWREGEYPAVVRWETAELYARWLGARLPSIAEWDHLARGGDDSPAGHRHVDRLNEVAWTWHNTGSEPVAPFEDPLVMRYRENARGPWVMDVIQWRIDAARGGRAPRPVGGLAPNAYGLHDVFGNVWEWTSDRFDPSPPIDAHPRDGGPLDLGQGLLRMQRGGDFAAPFWFCFVTSSRQVATVDPARNCAGVRLVRELPE